jgi:hypothetical protein
MNICIVKHCRMIAVYRPKADYPPTHCYRHARAAFIRADTIFCIAPGCQMDPNYAPQGCLPRYCRYHVDKCPSEVFSRSRSGRCTIKVPYLPCVEPGCRHLVLSAIIGGQCEQHYRPDVTCIRAECNKLATFGILFGPATHCEAHAETNYYEDGERNAKCVDPLNGGACYTRPRFANGEVGRDCLLPRPRRCADHRLANDYELFSRACSMCGLVHQMRDGQLICEQCIAVPASRPMSPSDFRPTPSPPPLPSPPRTPIPSDLLHTWSYSSLFEAMDAMDET